jgi:hypothetical protein
MTSLWPKTISMSPGNLFALVIGRESHNRASLLASQRIFVIGRRGQRSTSSGRVLSNCADHCGRLDELPFVSHPLIKRLTHNFAGRAQEASPAIHSRFD